MYICIIIINKLQWKIPYAVYFYSVVENISIFIENIISSLSKYLTKKQSNFDLT